MILLWSNLPLRILNFCTKNGRELWNVSNSPIYLLKDVDDDVDRVRTSSFTRDFSICVVQHRWTCEHEKRRLELGLVNYNFGPDCNYLFLSFLQHDLTLMVVKVLLSKETSKTPIETKTLGPSYRIETTKEVPW